MLSDLPNRTVVMYSFKVEGKRMGWKLRGREMKKGKEAKAGFLKEKERWGTSNPGVVNSFWCQLQVID